MPRFSSNKILGGTNTETVGSVVSGSSIKKVCPLILLLRFPFRAIALITVVDLITIGLL